MQIKLMQKINSTPSWSLKVSQAKRKTEEKHVGEAGALAVLISNALNTCLLDVTRDRELKANTSNTICIHNQQKRNINWNKLNNKTGNVHLT